MSSCFSQKQESTSYYTTNGPTKYFVKIFRARSPDEIFHWISWEEPLAKYFGLYFGRIYCEYICARELNSCSQNSCAAISPAGWRAQARQKKTKKKNRRSRGFSTQKVPSCGDAMDTPATLERTLGATRATRCTTLIPHCVATDWASFGNKAGGVSAPPYTIIG